MRKGVKHFVLDTYIKPYKNHTNWRGQITHFQNQPNQLIVSSDINASK
jgi:hypothetical protein